MTRDQIYDDDLVTVKIMRSTVTMDKPRYFELIDIFKAYITFKYVGQAILDISKIVMYDFHYDFIMKNYPQTELLFTDTGNLE